MVLVADKDKVKNLKAKCKELEHTVSRLTEQLAMNDAAKKMELANMEDGAPDEIRFSEAD